MHNNDFDLHLRSVHLSPKLQIQKIHKNIHKIKCYRYNTSCVFEASVTILADFGPEFNPPFHWRSKHQTKITVHIIKVVYSEFPNRSCRSVRSFISTLNCT